MSECHEQEQSPPEAKFGILNATITECWVAVEPLLMGNALPGPRSQEVTTQWIGFGVFLMDRDKSGPRMSPSIG
jgi:hypothetical protein